jgi:hypothetical protein
LLQALGAPLRIIVTTETRPKVSLIQQNSDIHMSTNPTTEVHLRRRSTPYEFVVAIRREGDSLCLYNGRSYRYALAAYWQAVNTLRFVSSPGQVCVDLTENRKPYGGFLTERDNDGTIKSLHVPSGHCIEWADGGWSGDNLARKLIATIPGLLRPIRHSS